MKATSYAGEGAVRWPQSNPSPVLLKIMKIIRHPWYKPRGYVHFDEPLSRVSAERLVVNASEITKHAFYPFLRYTVETKKIKKDAITGLVVLQDPKKRPISFAAHADAHIYSYYCYILTKHYEERINEFGLGDSILAFRSLGKSNIDFANQAFERINTLGGCVAFATDISSFFDHLNHLHLKKAWTALLGVPQLPPDHYAVFKSCLLYTSPSPRD